MENKLRIINGREMKFSHYTSVFTTHYCDNCEIIPAQFITHFNLIPKPVLVPLSGGFMLAEQHSDGCVSALLPVGYDRKAFRAIKIKFTEGEIQ